MALEQQTLAITLAQGVDTKTNPKQVVAGKLLTLENGFFQTPQSIRKAYGFTAQTTLSQTSYFQESYNDELISLRKDAATTGGVLGLSYSPSSGIYRNLGFCYPAKITMQVANNAGTSGGDTFQDVAYDSATNILCTCYNTVGRFTTIDRTTGGKIVSRGLIGGGSSVGYKVLNFQNRFVFLYVNTDHKLYYVTLTPTSATPSAPVLVSANVNTSNPTFDAQVINNRIYIAFNYTTTGVSVLYINSAFSISSETHDTTAAATGCITIWDGLTDANVIWVAYSNNTNVYAVQFTAALVVSATAAVVAATANINQITGISMLHGGVVNEQIFYANYSTGSVTNLVNAAVVLVSAGAVFGDVIGVVLRAACIGSKPIYYNTSIIMAANYCDAFGSQPTGFLFAFPIVQGGEQLTSANAQAAVVIGKFAATQFFDASHTPTVPEFINITTGVYQTAFLQATGGAEIYETGSAAILNIDFTSTPQSLQIANTLHITGGQLWMYDSGTIVEHSFHLYPDNMSAVVTATGGIPAGAYEYIAVYEWVDATGRLHRSAPSPALSVTVAAGGASNIAVTASTLFATNKSNAQVAFYRTDANGTIFYFVTYVANSKSANTVSFNDTHTTVAAGTELYTTGGQVENASAPPCQALATFKSRLIVIPSDNPYAWWFSQEVTPTTAAAVATPVELSEFLINNIDEAGGPLTAAAAMDDKLILMKSGAPYYVVGDGPSVNGSGSTFSLPQPITAPVGCTSAASLVVTPMGCIFQAANSAGLWLLDRSLNASYIGADVETYNASAVTSAVLYPQYNQVRFSSAAGVLLTFDYLMKQWTVQTGHTAVQACIWRGAYTYIKSDGTALKEDSSLFTNNGSFVSLKLVTSWLQFAGIQGYQRVYGFEILGTWQSAHNLTVSVAYDFSTSYAQTATITAPTSIVPYQYGISTAIQKCEAIQILIQDVNTGTPAESMSLTGLNLLAGIKKGQQRLPPTQTY